MPFDANGNFSLVPGTIVADGMNVLPSQHNPPFQDVANGLSQAVVRDGRAPMTGPLNMNGNKITGVAAGDAPDDVVTNAAIADLGVAIGDGKWSLRDLSPNWLRRDGSLYLRADYPDLADLLPPMPDGVIWDKKPIASNPSLSGILKIDGGYVVCGGSGYLAVSDGEDGWITKDSGVATTLSFLGEGAGIYFTGGSTGTFLKSSDLNTWSPISLSGTNATQGFYYDGSNFFVMSTNVGAPVLHISPDSNSWTPVTVPGSSAYIAMASNGSVHVLVGASGVVATSSNGGSTWTSRTSGTSNSLRDIVWDPYRNIFIAIGASGTVITSPDGLSWATRTSGTTQRLNAVIADSTGTIILGDSGVVRLSTNGTTYTTPVSSLSESILGATFAHDPRDFVGVGSGGLVAFGSRTSPTQFRVPNDDPTYGWIRAL